MSDVMIEGFFVGQIFTRRPSRPPITNALRLMNVCESWQNITKIYTIPDGEWSFAFFVDTIKVSLPNIVFISLHCEFIRFREVTKVVVIKTRLLQLPPPVVEIGEHCKQLLVLVRISIITTAGSRQVQVFDDAIKFHSLHNRQPCLFYCNYWPELWPGDAIKRSPVVRFGPGGARAIKHRDMITIVNTTRRLGVIQDDTF